MLARTLVVTVGSLLFLAAPSRASVTVVDPGGGPGVVLLQAAIDAAADGDVLLLRPGIYFDDTSYYYAIDSKGLTIEPDKGVGQIITNSFLINLDAGQTIVLRALQIGRPDDPNHEPVWNSYALDVITSFGIVWVEDCDIYGHKGWAPDVGNSSQNGGEAVGVQAGGSGPPGSPPGGATFVRCTLTGGSGYDTVAGGHFGSAGGDGLYCFRGTAVLHDCVVTAGRAGDGTTSTGLPTAAGAGVRIDDPPGEHTTLLLSGCSVTGGTECHGPIAGISGSGLSCPDAAAQIRVRDSSFAAGAVVGAGTMAAAVNVAGTLVNYPESAKGLELPQLMASGDAGVARFTGEQGDAILLLLSAAPGYHDAPFKQGVLAVDLATLVPAVPVTVITDPSGELDIAFQMPALPAGFDYLLVATQAAYAQGGVLTLGNGSVLLWLAN